MARKNYKFSRLKELYGINHAWICGGNLKTGRDFPTWGQYQVLFALEGDELATEAEIVKELEADGDRIIQQAVVDEAGELVGCYWLYHTASWWRRWATRGRCWG